MSYFWTQIATISAITVDNITIRNNNLICALMHMHNIYGTCPSMLMCVQDLGSFSSAGVSYFVTWELGKDSDV